MKYLFLYLLSSLLSCNNTGEILIKNESNVKFDSTFFDINNLRIELGLINPKDSIRIKFDKNLVLAYHDVFYTLTLKIKDSTISSGTYFSNDLGYIPDTFKLEITKGLKIIQR